jgi:hypothetical protein
MRKSFPMRLLIVALWCGAAWAQGIQNRDVAISAGPSWNQSQTIAGTNVTLAGSSGFNIQIGARTILAPAG